MLGSDRRNEAGGMVVVEDEAHKEDLRAENRSASEVSEVPYLCIPALSDNKIHRVYV